VTVPIATPGKKGISMNDPLRCTYKWRNEYGETLRCMFDKHSPDKVHTHGHQTAPKKGKK